MGSGSGSNKRIKSTISTSINSYSDKELYNMLLSIYHELTIWDYTISSVFIKDMYAQKGHKPTTSYAKIYLDKKEKRYSSKMTNYIMNEMLLDIADKLNDLINANPNDHRVSGLNKFIEFLQNVSIEKDLIYNGEVAGFILKNKVTSVAALRST